MNITTTRVIYFDKHYNNWCYTSTHNYLANNRLRGQVLVNGDFKEINFDTPEEFRDYLISKGRGTIDDYTIIPKEIEQCNK